MAIRDVGGKAAAPAPSAQTAQPAQPAGGAVPPALAKAMNDAGLVPPGGDPRAVLQQLLGGLRQQGFAAPPKMPAADQLRQMLVAAQRQHNLPATGNLDATTAALLKNLGVAADASAKRDPAQKDGFEAKLPSIIRPEGAPKKHKADDAAGQQQAPNRDFVDGLLNMLGGAGAVPGEASKEAGGQAVFGAGRGVEVQHAQGQAAVSGAAAAKEGKETAGPTKRDVDAPPQPHGLEKGNAAGVKVARGLQAKETKTDERQRAPSTARYDPTSRGVDDGDEDALEGAGEDGRRKRGHGGGDHDGAGEEGVEQAAAGTAAEADATERDAGNANSGRADEDPRRGHASVDDGSEDGAGHYRVPPVSEQAWAALALLAKDDDEDNRATTYSWDATFYRPAVYGAGQQAQELLHLVVKKAGAFDPVWQQSINALAALVRRFEADADVPTVEHIQAALRQERVKDAAPAATFDASMQKALLSRTMKA